VNEGKVTHAAAMEKVHDHEGFKRLVHRAEPIPGSGGPGQEFSTAYEAR
jgi:hypothetical protein